MSNHLHKVDRRALRKLCPMLLDAMAEALKAGWELKTRDGGRHVFMEDTAGRRRWTAAAYTGDRNGQINAAKQLRRELEKTQ